MKPGTWPFGSITRKPFTGAKCRKFRASEVTEKNVRLFCLEWFPDGTPDMERKDLQKIDWEEIAENWATEFEDVENG